MYLENIAAHKREEVRSMKLLSSERMRCLYDPVDPLKEKPFIAEIKRASPSMGDIKRDADVVLQAGIYERGGAGAISILTDEKFFKGSMEFLTRVGDTVKIPLLCKDFILSEVQIENAYISGADFILLIVSILSENELTLLSKRAAELGMKVLYELHDIEEFEKIKKLDLELIGVNSRNLKTFKIDRVHAGKTLINLKMRGGDFIKVAESGIESKNDIRFYRDLGADAFLIGTALMRTGNPAEKLKEFYSGLE